MNKKNIYLMYAISCLYGMVFYSPIATLYRQAQGVSVFQITIIESISLILCVFLEFPWGVIADRIGYKYTMMFCCVLYFISKVVFWKADRFSMFLLERIMLSVVISGLSGVDISILYLSCNKTNSEHIFGIYNGLGNVGLLSAAFFYSLFIKNDYGLAGLMTAISYGIAMILAFFIDEVSPKEKELQTMQNTISAFKNILTNKSFIFLLIGIACLSEVHQTVTVFLSQIKYLMCNLSSAAIGIIYVAVSLTGICGVFSSKIAMKLGKKQSALLYYAAAAASCGMLVFTNNAAMAILSILALRLVFSLFDPLQMDIQNMQVLTDNRATELSINSTIITLVGIVTNLIFGRLAEYNISFAFGFGAVICTFGASMFIISLKKINI